MNSYDRYYDPDGKPITQDEWTTLFEKRHTDEDSSWWSRKTQTPNGEVSTVWLGLNHAYFDGPPLFWESMVFGGDHDEEMQRYSSREDAWKGHDELVARLTE